MFSSITSHAVKLALPSAGAVALAVSSLVSPTPASAIAGGWDLDWNANASAMVSIGTNDWCSGAVIGDPSVRHSSRVLTAWHCIEGYASQNIQVFSGGNTLGSGRLYRVASTQRLSYNGGNDADGVILNLTSDITDIQPFPWTKTEPKYNDQVTVDGYGLTDTQGNTRLKQANMTFINSTQLGTPNGDRICTGDSGGPVLDSRGYIFGIIRAGADLANCYVNSPLHPEYVSLSRTNMPPMS
ncbi:trypsin-like serine protease [Streptomyces hygroscopicus]|uniref:trypsin-like serine protease n=1 Tax=Streptomyces hygroscopicus TaxID=1912 RepID=UPI003644E852